MSVSKSSSVGAPGNRNSHPDHMQQSNLAHPPVGLQPSHVSNAGVPQPSYVSAGVPQPQPGFAHPHAVGLQPSYVVNTGVPQPQPGFVAAPQPGYVSVHQQSGYVTNVPVALPPGYVAAPQSGYVNGQVVTVQVPAKPYEEYPPYCCCYMNEHDPRCCVAGKDCNGRNPFPKPVLNLGSRNGKITCGAIMTLTFSLIIITIIRNAIKD